MKLMTVEEYRNTFYTEGSRPSKRKIIRMIKNGSLNGQRQGRNYYINVGHDSYIEPVSYDTKTSAINDAT